MDHEDRGIRYRYRQYQNRIHPNLPYTTSPSFNKELATCPASSPSKLYFRWDDREGGYLMKDISPEFLDEKVTAQDILLILSSVNKVTPPRLNRYGFPIMLLSVLVILMLVIGLLIYIIKANLLLRGRPALQKRDLGLGISAFVILSLLTFFFLTRIATRIDEGFDAKRRRLVLLAFDRLSSSIFKDKNLQLFLSPAGAVLTLCIPTSPQSLLVPIDTKLQRIPLSLIEPSIEKPSLDDSKDVQIKQTALVVEGSYEEDSGKKKEFNQAFDFQQVKDCIHSASTSDGLVQLEKPIQSREI